MRRIRTTALSVGVALVAMASLVLVSPASPAGAAPYCGINWGSLAKQDPTLSQAQIFNLRAGRHQCYDRLVVDLRFPPAPGYNIRYVPQVVEDGTGDPIPLRGGAFLHVTVNAPSHDPAGRPTYAPPNKAEAVNVSGFRTFRQVHFDGTFEGYTTIGLGVRARLPFRVFIIPGPGSGSRLVLDVAHRWTT